MKNKPCPYCKTTTNTHTCGIMRQIEQASNSNDRPATKEDFREMAEKLDTNTRTYKIGAVFMISIYSMNNKPMIQASYAVNGYNVDRLGDNGKYVLIEHYADFDDAINRLSEESKKIEESL